MNKEMIEQLIEEAKRVRKNAYAPYSGFQVGAAMLCCSGEIYAGCNVENASFGATLCAERNAIAAAVAAGQKKFEAIAVYAEDEQILPCGICLQVLSEFSMDITVICCGKNTVRQFQLNELLPYSFTKFDTNKETEINSELN
jgi:cytidine deaminase